MPRITTRVGDVFSVPLDNGTKKYIHYVANDLTQLNSDVIRAYKSTYSNEATPGLEDIVRDATDFYAHCVTKWGVELGLWTPVGNCHERDGLLNVIFRDTEDYGNHLVTISQKWWIWRINEDQRFVGPLPRDLSNAEIGIVVSPDQIVHRLKTGKYAFKYPAANG